MSDKVLDTEVGIKYDTDKPDMSLLSSIALTELTKVLDFGKKKYAAHNWRKGISSTRLLGAALRHIFAYLGGEDKDPETGLSHIAHAMCCCMFILELGKTHPQLDDRHFSDREVVVPAVDAPFANAAGFQTVGVGDKRLCHAPRGVNCMYPNCMCESINEANRITGIKP